MLLVLSLFSTALAVFGTTITIPAGQSVLSLATGFVTSSGLDFVLGLSAGVKLEANSGGMPPSFAPISLLGTQQATAVAVGDVTDDGKADVVVGDSTSASIVVAMGTNTSSLTISVPSSVGTSILGLALGKFTDDNNVDVFIVGQSPDTVALYQGLGNGSFALFTSFVVNATVNPLDVACANLNSGDNFQDCVVSLRGDNTLRIYHGNATGISTNFTDIVMAETPLIIAMKDINEDGAVDFVVTHGVSNSFSVFINQNSTTVFNFTRQLITMSAGCIPTGVALGRFTQGDTNVDIAVACSQQNAVQIYTLNISSIGLFYQTPVFPLITGLLFPNLLEPIELVTGMDSLVVTGANLNTTLVLLNEVATTTTPTTPTPTTTTTTTLIATQTTLTTPTPPSTTSVVTMTTTAFCSGLANCSCSTTFCLVNSSVVVVNSSLTTSLPLVVNGSLVLSPTSSITVSASTVSGPLVTVLGNTTLGGDLHIVVAGRSQTIVVMQSFFISGKFDSVSASTSDSCTQVDSANPNYGSASMSVTVSVSSTCLSSGAIAGIVLGSVVGTVLVILLGVLLFKAVRRRADVNANMQLRGEEMRNFR